MKTLSKEETISKTQRKAIRASFNTIDDFCDWLDYIGLDPYSRLTDEDWNWIYYQWVPLS
jgi:ribosomal protein S12 methylthiotransferase accessory factor YcaO